MAHITLGNEYPGIRGLMTYRPETAAPLNALVDILLRGPHTLSAGERELIATFVSARNECRYCQSVHGAVAAHHLGGDAELVDAVKSGALPLALSRKMTALLAIAGKTADGGRQVTAEDIARAKAEGASDLEIHDTVLIAAVFCMCNRYVDGLATWAPSDPAFYRSRAALIAEHGYSAATIQTDTV